MTIPGSDFPNISLTEKPQPIIPALPFGFEWRGNCVIHDFEMKNQQIRLIISVPKKEDVLKTLESFTQEKIKMLGEISIAAGLGRDAVKIAFKRNELGECEGLEKHFRSGKTQVFNEKHFQIRRSEIEKMNDEGEKRAETSEVESLERLLKSARDVFKTHAYTGKSLHEQNNKNKSVSDASDDAHINQLKESVLKETKINVPKNASKENVNEVSISDEIQKAFDTSMKFNNLMKNLLKKHLGKDSEMIKLINKFVDENLESVKVEKFIDDLILEVDVEGFPKKDIQISEEKLQELIKIQSTVVSLKKRFETKFKSNFGEQGLESWIRFKNQNPHAKIRDYEAYRNELI